MIAGSYYFTVIFPGLALSKNSSESSLSLWNYTFSPSDSESSPSEFKLFSRVLLRDVLSFSSAVSSCSFNLIPMFSSFFFYNLTIFLRRASTFVSKVFCFSVRFFNLSFSRLRPC